MTAYYQGDYALLPCPTCGHWHGFHRDEVHTLRSRRAPRCRRCGGALVSAATELLGLAGWRRKLLRYLAAKLLALLLLGLGFAWQLPTREQTLQIATHLRYEIDARSGSWKAIAPVFQSIDELPEHVPLLLVMSEDRRYFWHPGIDPIAVLRAMYSARGGGSTISQQLARTLAGYDRSPSVLRKLREAVYALKLETEFSKRELLQMYLNNVWFGSGAYGIEHAAREYFGKHAAQLTALEAAILVRTLPHPSSNWHTHPAESLNRAQVLLKRFEQRHGRLPQGDMRIAPGILQRRSIDTASILDSIKSRGLPACGDRYLLVTTIDPTMQIYAELAVSRQLQRYRARNVHNGALISLDQSGAAKALVPTGNRQFSQLDHAFQVRRPPGSAIKPLVYLIALRQGWSLDDPISAERFIDPSSGWSPRNHNNRYPKTLSVRDALAHSYNTAAVRLLQAVGPARMTEAARALDFHYDHGDAVPLAMALGPGTTTLAELAELYATIEADGDIRHSYSHRGAVDAGWGICQWRTAPTPPTPAKDVDSYRQLKQAMIAVVESGTGRSARLHGKPWPAKTGTSDQYRDAWFVGSYEGHTTAVWFGNGGSAMNQVEGGDIGARAVHEFLVNVQQGAERGRSDEL